MQGWIFVAFVIAAVLLVINIVNKKQAVAAKIVIGLFIFMMLSAGYVYAKYDVDLSSFEGLVSGGKLYVSWLGTVFNNGAQITGYAIKQDWSGNLSQQAAAASP